MSKLFRNKTYLLYAVLLFFTGIVLLFTNIGYDSEYQLAMAYRMLKGDFFITQMWEPHQTSAFLCAAFMKIFIMITGRTKGIVLYTQFVGLFLRTAISVYMFGTLKKIIGDKPALLSGLIFFLVSPKDILTPDFSNMQLWFAALLFLFLVRYYDSRKKIYLILSAVSLCLGVLSYPSFLLAYFAVSAILRFEVNKRDSSGFYKDFLIFTGVCAVIGFGFIALLLTNMDFDTMLKCLSSALSLEPTHTVESSGKFMVLLKGIVQIAAILIAVSLAGVFIEKIFSIKKLKFGGLSHFIAFDLLLIYFACNIISAENRNWYSTILVFITIVGFLRLKLTGNTEKDIYFTGLYIGLSNLVATMLLSDHGFMQAVPYAAIILCVSVIPLYKWFLQLRTDGPSQKMYTFSVHAFLLLLIFRCFYVHVPISGRGQICSILDDSSFIKDGPAFGIYTNDDGVVRQRDSMAEWELYIEDGDKIWILDEPVDTLGYMYKDTEVSAPTVMSTPSYSKELLYYWELNPDKYPDVVILAAANNDLSYDILKNEWLMDWLYNEYKPTEMIYGTYWCYCFK